MLLFLQICGGHSGSSGLFSRRVVGHGNVCRWGVADKKKPRKIGFRDWLRGFFDGMFDMFSSLCCEYS